MSIRNPLETTLQDPEVWVITINRYDSIYAGREAFRMERVEDSFDSEEHLLEYINGLLEPLGTKLSAALPIIDVRLSDGTRMNAATRPIAPHGTTVTFHKPVSPHRMPTWEVLLKANSISQQIVDFFQLIAKGWVSTLVSGGKGSGKTTLLNLIAQLIPEQVRLVVVEPDFHLIFSHPNRVHLHPRPANIEGAGAISMRHVMEAAAQMRPDRLVSSEVTGAEALPFLDAIEQGAIGSMVCIHATSPRDALARLEVMVTEANPTLPLANVRSKIASNLDLIVQIDILGDGWRKVMRVSEITDLVDGQIELEDIYVFEQTGKDETGKVLGNYVATGYVPSFANRLASWGVVLPETLFK